MKREVNYKNIRYGMLVEVLHDASKPEGNYHSGMKVHFFNERGALVGNYYEFLPYDRLRFRPEDKKWYPRYYMHHRFEKIRAWLLIQWMNCLTQFIKVTENHIGNDQLHIYSGNYKRYN